MITKANTVDEWLTLFDEEKSAAMKKLRTMARKAFPKALESMQYGMPSYFVNEQPVVCFNVRKNYLAPYIMDTDLLKNYKKSFGKLDCGKSCIRFKRVDDLPLKTVETIFKEMAKRRK
jgi:uncharacterized protein YdhG (YjbR/CyaY superfamily)